MLDQHQRQVVTAPKDVNMKVVGGPGSGKTMTYVDRYINLYTRQHVEPERILAVTYSKKAAAEMLSRIKLKIDLSVKAEYNISTIHGFCLRTYNAWRAKSGKKPVKVWQYGDNPLNPAYKAAELLAKYIGSNDMSIFESTNSLLKSIPDPTSNLLIEHGVHDKTAKLLFNMWKEYEIWMKQNDLIDYAGQLWNIDRLIHHNPFFKALVSSRYDKIMVDEGQDMFEQTYRILLILAEASSFEAYGDGSQSIYGFNGAAPHMFDTLEDRVEGMQVYHLANNYRSNLSIVDVTNNFGPFTTDRFKPMVCVNNDRKGQVYIGRCGSISGQADYIANEIVTNEYRFGDTYVLCRTNSQCASIHQRLLELGVPSYYPGKYSIWDKSHMRAGLGYMSIAKEKDSQDDLINVLNVPSEDFVTVFGRTVGQYIPTRFLSKTAFQGLAFKDLLNGNFTSTRGQRPGIKNLTKYVERLKGMDDDRSRAADIDNSIAKWARFNGNDYMGVQDDLSMLWDKLENLDYNVDDLRIYIQKSNEARRKIKKDRNQVQVMTIHAAKGLEAINVFVTGLSQPRPTKHLAALGFHPGRNTNEEINEENCLFYTSISRAIENLHLTWYEHSNGVDYILSSFITDYLLRKALKNEETTKEAMDQCLV